MLDSSRISYSPYNLYQNYGYDYSMFKGVTLPKAQNVCYNDNSPQMIQQPDTDTFSSSNQKRAETKPRCLSLTSKVLIGIATVGTLVGGYILHKKMTSPATKLSKIFRREVTSDEATKLMDRYKEIAKIENKEEYISQMFKQLKKDYGWENINFTYNLNRSSHIAEASGTNAKVTGGFRPLGISGKTLPNGDFVLDRFTPEIMEVCLNRSKEDIFSTMVHEFQHCKQHELAYRADKNKFIEAMIKHRLSPEMTEEIAMYKDAIDKYYAPVWDKLPVLKKGSKEYSQGLKYIDEIEHYISASQDKKAYWQQLTEKEARLAGKQAQDVYRKAVS